MLAPKQTVSFCNFPVSAINSPWTNSRIQTLYKDINNAHFSPAIYCDGVIPNVIPNSDVAFSGVLLECVA